MQKRSILILLLLAVCVIWTSAEEMDMIVLLDVSESMFPYFDDTVNFLLKDIIDEHLEYGDGFHLLSFASNPEREIYRVIKNPSDMEAVLARIMLLHPLGKYTDLLFALNYLYDYVAELPLSTSKNILILTDGIHDPPPGSAYPAATAEQRESNRQSAIDISTALKREGWRVRLIEFPRGEASVEENGTVRNDLYAPMADTLGVDVIPYENDSEISHTATGAPALEFPGPLGRVGHEFTVPFKIRNYLNDTIIVKLDKILSRNENILEEPVSLRIGSDSSATLNAKVALPDLEPGEYLLDVELVFSDGLRIYPRSGELSFVLQEPSFSWIKWPLIVIVIAVAGFILIFYTIIPLRRHIEGNADNNKGYIGLKPARDDRDESRNSSASTADTLIPGSPGTAGRRPSGKIPLMEQGQRQGSKTPEPGNQQQQSGKVPLLAAGSRGDHGRIPLSQVSTYRSAGSMQSVKPLGDRPIEFRLSGQNPYNGGRNIRWIGGNSRSIGGGNSYFSIFLVKVPEKIAEVSFTPDGLTLRPLKPEFFPDISQELANCIGRPIRLHTDHGDFTMFFTEWISPLERLNTLLHLADEAGMKNYPPSQE